MNRKERNSISEKRDRAERKSMSKRDKVERPKLDFSLCARTFLILKYSSIFYFMD